MGASLFRADILNKQTDSQLTGFHRGSRKEGYSKELNAMVREDEVNRYQGYNGELGRRAGGLGPGLRNFDFRNFGIGAMPP